jgi:hypothetical protein
MNIVMYGIVWNEELMLPYFFRHYDSIVDRYVIYDHDSDDRTQQILNAHPRVTMRRFDVQGESVCECARDVKSNAWKESRDDADLVLVCDVDELLWHPRLSDYLSEAIAAGETVFHPRGWDMVSSDFPTTDGQIYDEVLQGFRNHYFDKFCLFNPNAVEEINFQPGCHFASPQGEIVCNLTESLKLLHFKYLGVDYVTARYAALGAKLKSDDKVHGYGKQYFQTSEEIRKQFAEFQLQLAIDC